MVRRNNNPSSQMDKGLLAKLAIGVSPIPVVGEIALACGFYDLLKNSGLPPVAGIPAAALTRFALYTEFYIPIAKQLGLIY